MGIPTIITMIGLGMGLNNYFGDKDDILIPIHYSINCHSYSRMSRSMYLMFHDSCNVHYAVELQATIAPPGIVVDFSRES